MFSWIVNMRRTPLPHAKIVHPLTHADMLWVHERRKARELRARTAANVPPLHQDLLS